MRIQIATALNAARNYTKPYAALPELKADLKRKTIKNPQLLPWR
jgi:hypothetical protein